MRSLSMSPGAVVPALASWLCALTMAGVELRAEESPLRERFAQPPADTRILKIIHGWPDAPAAQDDLIRRLSSQGFGGVVCNVSFDGYLEDESRWQAFTRAVRAARQAGWSLWLYDERGYPSGNAGGLVLKDHLEWEARGLLIADATTTGPPVDLAVPPGRLQWARAFPESAGRIDGGRAVDLAAEVHHGRLQWTPPAGTWRVLAVTEDRLYEGTHADGNLHQKMPYINLLRPEPTRRFLDLTYERYAERLGANLGETFVATFTDEPSLMSLFLRPMPYRVLPWSQDLPAEFAKRRGYPLEPIVADLIAEAGPIGQRHRYDYWLTIAELVSENFFGQIQDRCRTHGLPSGGHLLAEEGLVGHIPLYGDFLRCLRRLDAPSIDCLTSVPPEVPWLIARLAGSAAELEGRSLVMCETSDHAQRYRAQGDNRPVRPVTEAEIRGTCNRLMVAGVNRITSYYSFAGLDDAAIRRLNEWVGRCGFLQGQGQPVADVAVVMPTESLWVRFEPSRRWTDEAQAAHRIEALWKNAAESLFAARRDFTVVDAEALAGATVEPGELVHGPLRWRVVILPGIDTLPLAAWHHLAEFVRRGGIAVTLGSLPLNSESEFPAPTVQAFARELFGAAGDEPTVHSNAAGGAGIYLPHGSEALLAMALDAVLEPAATPADPEASIRITRRRGGEFDQFFVVNDSATARSDDVTFPADGPVEVWNPGTGKVNPVDTNRTVCLDLEPYGARFVRFRSAVPRAPRRPVGPGVLPGLSLQPLPVGSPRPVHGTFVKPELAPVEPSSGDPATWDARGTILKGQVDTFQFLEFPVTPGAGLSGAAGVAIETWVPDGQGASSQLLVILHEEGGGDFVGTTGRSLGQAGRARSFLPTTSFKLAGWSRDADGRLDLSHVTAIRIGWGGYLGREGETVAFRTGPPTAMRIAPRPESGH